VACRRKDLRRKWEVADKLVKVADKKKKWPINLPKLADKSQSPLKRYLKFTKWTRNAVEG